MGSLKAFRTAPSLSWQRVVASMILAAAPGGRGSAEPGADAALAFSPNAVFGGQMMFVLA